MLNLEALESYLTISDWRPVEHEHAEAGLCTRCGEREAAVFICLPCLLQIAARMSEERPKKKKRRMPGILEWVVVALFAFGALAAGSLLNTLLR